MGGSQEQHFANFRIHTNETTTDDDESIRVPARRFEAKECARRTALVVVPKVSWLDGLGQRGQDECSLQQIRSHPAN